IVPAGSDAQAGLIETAETLVGIALDAADDGGDAEPSTEGDPPA
ncbi:MAG: hypothetical protein QOI65_1281, partial [Thermoleophilaceae bacterium]|nr:hypothetical protein [Thermoleophilaceae bacterium]